MNFEFDLFQRRVIGWNLQLVAELIQRGLSPSVAGRLQAMLPLIEVTLLTALVAGLAALAERLWTRRPRAGTGWWIAAAGQAASALIALRLLYWVYLHPSRDLAGLLSRWDYLVFAIFGGVTLRRVALPVRVWTLAVLSIVLLHDYVGHLPFRVLFATCLLGFAATRWRVTNRPVARVIVQGALMAGALAWLLWLRASSPWDALMGWGLYSFLVFRHVSFVVETARGASSTLGGYLCYLLFFPNCFGAMEVYDEFQERNLTESRPAEFRRAALMVISGSALIWLGLVTPMDEDRVTASVGFASMWANLMVLFFRAAVGTIGAWNMIEGGALFLGFRLRPNFRYVLSATTPSQFWRAWRATMTNSLIRYVYIPLGGNRRHQTANIFAAFFVSTVWHCLGVPFLRPPTWTPYELVPIITWGAFNFAGVAVHAQVRRRWPAAHRDVPVRQLVVACKWALTMAFGAFTVLLLGFALGRVERFPHVMRTLVGLEGW